MPQFGNLVKMVDEALWPKRDKLIDEISDSVMEALVRHVRSGGFECFGILSSGAES